MELKDVELIARLTQRDGPIAERSPSHNPLECRYAEVYEGRNCPWCEAVERRPASSAGDGRSDLRA